jgi:hypothetical protein
LLLAPKNVAHFVVDPVYPEIMKWKRCRPGSRRAGWGTEGAANGFRIAEPEMNKNKLSTVACEIFFFKQ